MKSMGQSIERVLETCLYVSDLPAAGRFYKELFQLPVLFSDERLCAMDVNGTGVLLLFAIGISENTVNMAGGTIPPHIGVRGGHFAFAIRADQYEAWRKELLSRSITIESEVHWSRGGRSIYFRDPDTNLVELATPGLWPRY
jgi:catechol 2,3-dioxygenase-like lactoylglutathione lyase family enzyme